MRVYELAKELGVSNKELIARLRDSGVEVAGHMNAVPDEALRRIRAEYAPEATAPDKAPPPPEKLPVEQSAEQERASAAPDIVPREHPAPETPPEPARPQTAPPAGKVITFRGSIIVRDLAEQMGMKSNQLIADLMHMNVLASINERLDSKTAQQIAEKHGFVIEHEKKPADRKPVAFDAEDEEVERDLPEDLESRPPVVTFLGHIDHGKTSLLDRIRRSFVAAKEAGGITQHIGAYTVTRNERKITFLDTPGHAAFTAMRARGADLTDIAVVVIAADDGIMPQTTEAIKHAQAFDKSIIVAINKTDLPSANPENVMRQLQAADLTPEEWGGTVICCPVSAVTGDGIDHLLEMILLQAEMLELKANPKARAQGFIIEAQMEQGVGPTANMLVTNGTLHVGDVVVSGEHWGRVKSLTDDHGLRVRTACPATPIKCMGLSGIPLAGEKFRVYRSDKAARLAAESRGSALRARKMAVPKKASLEELFDRMSADKNLVLQMVLKCDTQGSLEAIQYALSEITSEKVTISIVLGGVGNVTVNDVLLASASGAIIVGFNVGKEQGVPALEKSEGVEIRLYGIIYNIIDDIRRAMTGMLAPELREKPMGRAEVRQVFDMSRKGKVAGCMVVSGRATARCQARLRRNDEIVYEGAIVSLKRFQDDVSEVREGMECGVRLDNFSELEPGDVIDFFEVEEVPQEL